MNSVDFASWINDTNTNGGGGTITNDRMKRLLPITMPNLTDPHNYHWRWDYLVLLLAGDNGYWQDGYVTGVDDIDYYDMILKVDLLKNIILVSMEH